MVKLLLFIVFMLAVAILVSVWFIFVKLQNLAKEIHTMNQARIDDLTKQLNDGNDAVVTTIKNEADEVKKAIENPTLDTSGLEKAISDSAALKDMVANIFTPDKPTPDTANPAPTGTEGDNTGTATETGTEGFPTDSNTDDASAEPTPAEPSDGK